VSLTCFKAGGSMAGVVLGVYSTLPLHLPLESLLKGIASSKSLLALLSLQVSVDYSVRADFQFIDL
jgi:hypothetical protein